MKAYQKANNISERLLDFAADVIKLTALLLKTQSVVMSEDR